MREFLRELFSDANKQPSMKRAALFGLIIAFLGCVFLKVDIEYLKQISTIIIALIATTGVEKFKPTK